ncbi:MAG: dimethyladenosine transferase [Marteilia pararefringens]
MMDFKQWDDMVRILFNRKNKTLFSLLKKRNIIGLLDHNYKVYCKKNNIILDEKVEMRELVKNILFDMNFDQRRVKTMQIEELMELMVGFNKRGIFFS